MIKKVSITGLDCPNCAKQMENKFRTLESVEKIELNFLKQTLTVEAQDLDKAFNDIILQAKKMDSNVKIDYQIQSSSKQNKKTRNIHKDTIVDLISLFLGLILGACAILINNLSSWAFWSLFCGSAIIIGYKTYIKAFKLLFVGTINENLLVTISVIGAVVVGEAMESLMVIALYTIGKILENLAVNKSRKLIESLTNFKPDYATIIIDDEEKIVLPSEVKINDTIIVKPGEKVPLDGEIIEGNSSLDVQSLTGESLPVNLRVGENVLSGSVVLDGVLKIRVTSIYKDSTVNKIMTLIENAEEKKSKTETFISKIIKWYTLGVIALSVIVFGIVLLTLDDLNTAVYRGLIFLVVSCPCAFAISVPLSYFSGLGNASKNGILIKGSNYLDACAKLNLVAFDKTGTLTTGKFEIEKIEVYDKNLSKDDILYYASLGEQYSLHPLAKSIVEHNTRKLVKLNRLKEVAGEGIYFNYKNDSYFVGKTSKKASITSVDVVRNKVIIGTILLRDKVKDTAFNACQELKRLGVKTVLLSGDNQIIVNEVAKKTGVDESFAKLLPQDKFSYIENAQKEKTTKIGYVGDGLNDAPALTMANVGFAMGINGNSASIEASDIVLVDDDPEKVSKAIKISKFTRKIVWQNIIISALIKVTFLTLGSFGITGMLSAVIADVGVTVLAILNSLRALKYKAK